MLDKHLLIELKTLWVKRLLDSKHCIEKACEVDENWEDNLEALEALELIYDLKWDLMKMEEHEKGYHSPSPTPQAIP